MSGLFIRVGLDEARAVGPGKVRLLELIDHTGSISAAARAMGMSYRRAWLLVEDVNTAFAQPAVLTQAGGTAGGGATLSDWGRALIAHYRRIESLAEAAASAEVAALRAHLAPAGPTTPAKAKPAKTRRPAPP